MPRKKKEVKVKKPKKVKVKTYKAFAGVPPAEDIPEQKGISDIFKVFEASLLDAFRQYVDNRLKASQVASLEEFMNGFKYTINAQGISKEKLLGVLDEYELEYVKNTNKVKAASTEAPVAQIVPVPPPAAPTPVPEDKKETNSVSVFDSLDLI